MGYTAKVVLKAGRDAPARGGNPWIFSGAIERVEPQGPAPGSMVEIRDATGGLIGAGYYNPATTIAVRLLAWSAAPPLSEIISRRLTEAVALRRRIVGSGTDCFRLINGEGDGLAGVVVDRYADVLVVQLLTAGAERMREDLVARLAGLLHPRSIIERSQGAVRRQEGLADHLGSLAGELVSEAEAVENGAKIYVNFDHGQKTGCFLDQRENRARVQALANGARVLDLCCYSGGFAVAALRGGASRVAAVDTSARALAWARRNLELNGCADGAARLVHAEAAEYLKQTAERFDLIILDPPPLARSRKDARRAAHLYTELNALAMGALAPGGMFMTFSCSTHFRGGDFDHAVCMAQAKAGRTLRVLARLGPAADHPVLLGHAEGEYLTGLLLADLDGRGPGTVGPWDSGTRPAG